MVGGCLLKPVEGSPTPNPLKKKRVPLSKLLKQSIISSSACNPIASWDDHQPGSGNTAGKLSRSRSVGTVESSCAGDTKQRLLLELLTGRPAAAESPPQSIKAVPWEPDNKNKNKSQQLQGRVVPSPPEAPSCVTSQSLHSAPQPTSLPAVLPDDGSSASTWEPGPASQEDIFARIAARLPYSIGRISETGGGTAADSQQLTRPRAQGGTQCGAVQDHDGDPRDEGNRGLQADPVEQGLATSPEPLPNGLSKSQSFQLRRLECSTPVLGKGRASCSPSLEGQGTVDVERVRMQATILELYKKVAALEQSLEVKCEQSRLAEVEKSQLQAALLSQATSSTGSKATNDRAPNSDRGHSSHTINPATFETAEDSMDLTMPFTYPLSATAEIMEVSRGASSTTLQAQGGPVLMGHSSGDVPSDYLLKLFHNAPSNVDAQGGMLLAELSAMRAERDAACAERDAARASVDKLLLASAELQAELQRSKDRESMERQSRQRVTSQLQTERDAWARMLEDLTAAASDEGDDARNEREAETFERGQNGFAHPEILTTMSNPVSNPLSGDADTDIVRLARSLGKF